MEHQQIIQRLRERPETYNTLFGELMTRTNNTQKKRTRRKLMKLFKNGFIAKTIIPRSALLRIMFYGLDKQYYIIFKSNNESCETYYAKQYKDLGNKIMLENTYKLENVQWTYFATYTTLDKKEIITMF